MKTVILVGLAVLLVMALVIFACQRRQIAQPSLEEQLATLRKLGIELRPGIGVERLTRSDDLKEHSGEPPYERLLILMGGTTEEEPFEPLSEDIWHFDTECIEDHGAYVAIAERVRGLADGDLPLSEIDDYVDVEEGVAWLSFRLNGKQHKWDLKVDDDWVDPEIFVKFDQLLAEQGSKKRLTYYDLGGQDCLIGCGTEENLRALRRETGLNFKWMNQ